MNIGDTFTHSNGKSYEAVADASPSGCGGCAFDNDATGCIKTPACYTNNVIFKEIPVNAIQSAVAGNIVTSVPVPASIPAPPNGSAFIAARQRAWDGYADSRAKVTGFRPSPGLSRHEGYLAGFEAGFAAREPVIAALKLRSETSPAPVRKAGRLRDLILDSLIGEGPASAETLAKRLGRPLNSISPRFAHMLTAGLVHISGGEPALHGKGNRNVYSYGPVL